MTDLDADTLRDLRNLLAQYERLPGNTGAIRLLATGLFNAAPALLDAAEAVERIDRELGIFERAFARYDRMKELADVMPSPPSMLSRVIVGNLRAALATPPDKDTP